MQSLKIAIKVSLAIRASKPRRKPEKENSPAAIAIHGRASHFEAGVGIRVVVVV